MNKIDGEVKFYFLTIIIGILCFTIYSIFNTKNDIEIAKTGLEQCPSGTGNTIWVKSCTEYTEMMRKTK